MVILEIGIVFMAAGLILTALGYNLKLPGYSRKKMLEGISPQRQMSTRRMHGESIMQVGIITMGMTVFMIFFIFGIFMEARTTDSVPKETHITNTQAKTVVIADGEVFVFDGIRHHIRRVYIKRAFNAYGMEIDHELIIEHKDQWEVLER